MELDEDGGDDGEERRGRLGFRAVAQLARASACGSRLFFLPLLRCPVSAATVTTSPPKPTGWADDADGRGFRDGDAYAAQHPILPLRTLEAPGSKLSAWKLLYGGPGPGKLGIQQPGRQHLQDIGKWERMGLEKGISI